MRGFGDCGASSPSPFRRSYWVQALYLPNDNHLPSAGDFLVREAETLCIQLHEIDPARKPNRGKPDGVPTSWVRSTCQKANDQTSGYIVYSE